jgi:hypothetical protein
MPDTLSRRADELAVDILQACADRQAVLGLIHRYGDARVAAHIDALTAALEAEWYNGNLDEKAYRRLCKIVGNEPYPSAILNGETP